MANGSAALHRSPESGDPTSCARTMSSREAGSWRGWLVGDIFFPCEPDLVSPRAGMGAAGHPLWSWVSLLQRRWIEAPSTAMDRLPRHLRGVEERTE
jgi:hypothetical protein